jgi:hypothetical protein
LHKAFWIAGAPSGLIEIVYFCSHNLYACRSNKTQSGLIGIAIIEMNFDQTIASVYVNYLVWAAR